MVSNSLARRLASAAVLVVAAALPAAFAHSADVADNVVSTTPVAVATPSISLTTPSSSATESYDPQTPPKTGTSTVPLATPTVSPSTAAASAAAAAAATTSTAAPAAPAAPSSKTSVTAKAAVTTKTPVRAATPKPSTTPPVAPSATAPAATTGGVTARQDLATAVAAATNAERVAAGLKPLAIKTCSVPASFAIQLATEGALYHNNLYTVLGGCGGGSTAGENIARGYSSVSGVTAGWMGSAGHRANILNANYKSIFVGVAQAANGTYYWVENFTG